MQMQHSQLLLNCCLCNVLLTCQWGSFSWCASPLLSGPSSRPRWPSTAEPSLETLCSSTRWRNTRWADLQSDRTLHYYTCTPPDLFMLTLIKVCVRSQTVVLSQCCCSRKSAKNMHGSGSGSTQARGPGTGLGYCVYLSAPAKTCNRFIMCAV